MQHPIDAFADSIVDLAECGRKALRHVKHKIAAIVRYVCLDRGVPSMLATAPDLVEKMYRSANKTGKKVIVTALFRLARDFGRLHSRRALRGIEWHVFMRIRECCRLSFWEMYVKCA